MALEHLKYQFRQSQISIFGYQSAFEENLNVDQESEGYADYFKKVAPVFGASQFNSVKFPRAAARRGSAAPPAAALTARATTR